MATQTLKPTCRAVFTAPALWRLEMVITGLKKKAHVLNSQHDERSWRLHNACGVLNTCLPAGRTRRLTTRVCIRSPHELHGTKKDQTNHHATKAPRPSPSAPRPEIHLNHPLKPRQTATNYKPPPQKRQNANPQTTGKRTIPNPRKKKCPPSASACASPLRPALQPLLPPPAPRPSPFP